MISPSSCIIRVVRIIFDDSSPIVERRAMMKLAYPSQSFADYDGSYVTIIIRKADAPPGAPTLFHHDIRIGDRLAPFRVALEKNMFPDWTDKGAVENGPLKSVPQVCDDMIERVRDEKRLHVWTHFHAINDGRRVMRVCLFRRVPISVFYDASAYR